MLGVVVVVVDLLSLLKAVGHEWLLLAPEWLIIFMSKYKYEK